MFHEHNKHIKVDCHFVCEKFEKSLIILPQVSSKDQLVDFFTKSQTKSCHNFYRNKLILFHHQFEGEYKRKE